MRAAIITIALLASTTLAQQPIPTFELERFSFNPGARETLTVGSADLLEARRLRLLVAGHYQHDPLVFTVDDQRAGALVGRRVTAHLVAAYGILDWLEVGLQLPIVALQGGDDLTRLGISAVTPTAIGAPLVQARAAFVQQRAGGPLDLGLSVSLSLPIGSERALTKDPGAGLAFTSKLAAGRSFGPVRVGGDLGAVLRGAAILSPQSSVIADEIGSQFVFGLAVSTTRALSRFRGELGVRGGVPFTQTGASVEVLGGGRVSFLDEQLELFALGGPGLGGAPGTPAFRLLLGLSWVPSLDDSGPRPGT